MDFSNSIRGISKSSVGTAEGVLIPYEYFIPGNSIHIWIVLIGDQYAITRYHITIPVSVRALPTDEEPTPEQQGYVDQALAALNQAIAQTADDVAASGENAERAETAAENAEQAVANVQETVDAALQEAKDSGEFDGPQGEQGIQGDPGPTGDPGAMLAFSPPTIERVINNGKVRAGSISMPFAAYLGNQRIACTAMSFASTEWTVQITQSTDSSNGQIRISWGERTVGTSLPKSIRFDFAFNNITVTCYVPVTHVYDGAKGATGTQGATFTPTVSAEGVISWSNDGGLPNPENQNIKGPSGAATIVQVSGATPTIAAQDNHRYICGEVAMLDITLPASGCIDVVFESGSTPTVLTITPPTWQTLKWANGFDPTALEANTTYEINIADGLGVAGQWT